MTDKPVAYAKARKAKAAAMERIAQLEHMQRCMHQLLISIIDRCNVSTFVFDEAELEATHPGRIVIANIPDQRKWVVATKADGDAPVELNLTKRALQGASDAPG